MKEKNILRFTLILSAFCLLGTYSRAQVYINVNIDQPPLLMTNAGTAQTICAGGNAPIGGIANGGTNPYTFAWSPSTGLSNATVANSVASPSMTTTYYLTVTDANNCTSMDSVMVAVDPCGTGVNNASGGTEKDYFSIAPNPNRGLFSVILSSILLAGQAGRVNNLVALEIYNFLGERVYSVSYINRYAPVVISIGGMNKGIYLVKVSYENATYTEKLIIE